MLTIICGEDSVSAREYYQKLKTAYESKSVFVQAVHPKDIIATIRTGEQTIDLFSQKTVYFTENLNAYLSRAGRKLPEGFEELFAAKDSEIIDWESEKSGRDLKIAKLGKVKEFKPGKTIFQLLDACYPTNKKQFLLLLDAIGASTDGVFIYTMLARHIRSLLLAKNDTFSSRVAPWQRGKLSSQAKKWDEKKLVGFYEGLHRVDIALKTSATPYTVKESLDILACYYL